MHFDLAQIIQTIGYIGLFTMCSQNQGCLRLSAR